MSPATPLHGCFVTGTDTEIGKTRICAALLHWLARSGWRSAGFKPVSAGTDVIDGQRVNEDVRALREAGSLALTNAEVGPLQLEAACVPLGADWDTAELARDLDLPVVLVVGLRLGCINHALLTAEAVRARGLRLAGWVGNRIVRDMPWADENVATLRDWLWRRHGAPCLGVVPWLADPHPAAVAAHLDAAALRAVFAPIPAAFSS